MIRHIVAVDSRRGIAKNGSIPWNLPVDKKYYRAMIQTHGGILLMGRNTYERAGVTIAGHDCYVLTRDVSYTTKGAKVIHNLDEFIKANGDDDIWVIGGADIYRDTLEFAHELYVTEIEHNYICNAFYPEYDNGFEESDMSPVMSDEGIQFRFKVYTPRVK